jgi:hypothetical protein
MAEPNPPRESRGAKDGHEPGKAASTQPEKDKRGKRPVDEEDAFGGAERTHNEDVESPNAKP